MLFHDVTHRTAFINYCDLYKDMVCIMGVATVGVYTMSIGYILSGVNGRG